MGWLRMRLCIGLLLVVLLMCKLFRWWKNRVKFMLLVCRMVNSVLISCLFLGCCVCSLSLVCSNLVWCVWKMVL